MIKAYIFDAFGTLFNLDEGLLRHIKHPAVSDILAYARTKQLSYTWLHSLMQTYRPFSEITRIALTDACKKYDAPTELVEQLAPLYFEPTTFEDVLPTLEILRKSSFTTGILSNGTHAMLQSGIQKNGLGEYLDGVYSVDDIGVYKPTPDVYAMVTKSLNLQANEVLFSSSNQWDVAGAAQFGFQVAWVNRGGVFRESITKLANVHEVNVLTDITVVSS